MSDEKKIFKVTVVTAFVDSHYVEAASSEEAQNLIRTHGIPWGGYAYSPKIHSVETAVEETERTRSKIVEQDGLLTYKGWPSGWSIYR